MRHDGDILASGTITAPSGIFTDTLTVSGIPVNIGAGSASTLQEAYDGGDGTITTTTGKPFTVAGAVAVAGTLSVDDLVDFKDNTSISGVLQVGQIPVSDTASVASAFEEDDVNFTSTSYVDLGVETGPLAVGSNLLLFRASAGSTTDAGVAVNLKCVFGGVDAGESQNNTTAASSLGAWGAADLCGFKIVTGDGSSTAKLQADHDISFVAADASAMAIAAIPLVDMGLVVDTDFFFDNGSDSDFALPVASGLAAIKTVVVDVTEPGDYLFFGQCEAESQGTCNVRYFANNVQISTTYIRVSGVSDQRGYPFVQLLTLGAGINTFELKAQSITPFEGRFKRARICIVKASSFDQVVGLNSGTDKNTTSSTFTKVTSSEITYSPNQNESILVIANPDTALTALTNTPVSTYKLVNETDGIDSNVDAAPGKHVSTAEVIPTFLFTKVDDVSLPHTFSLSVREAEGTGENVRHNFVNMVVLSLSNDVTEGTQFSTITGDKISTPDVCADAIAVSDTLTVSGISTLGQLVAATGTFTDTLTVSGLPVSLEGGGGGGAALTVKEADGSPSVANVDTIVVTDGTLTDDGGGQVTISTGGTGGSSSSVGQEFSGAVLTTSGHDMGSSYIVTWTGAFYDTEGYFDPAEPTRLTVVGETITHVVVQAQGHFNPSAPPAANNSASYILNMNGALLFPDVRSKTVWPGDGSNSRVDEFVSYPIPVTSGDYFEVNASDNSAGELGAARTWFSIENATPSSGTGGGTTSSGSGGVTSSGSYYFADAPPFFPSQFDDEFDTYTGNEEDSEEPGLLDDIDTSVWTQWNPGGDVTFRRKFGEGVGPNGVGWSNTSDPGGAAWGGYVRPIAEMTATVSGNQAYWFDTKVELGERSEKRGLAGICFGGDLIGNPTTEEIFYIALASNVDLLGSAFERGASLIVGSTAGVLYNAAITSSAVDSPATIGGSGPGPTSMYLRIGYDGPGDGFTTQYSTDGRAWNLVDNDGGAITSGTLGFNPQTVGIINRCEDAGGFFSNHQFFRFRKMQDVNNAAGRITMTRLPVHGRRVPIVTGSTSDGGGGGGGTTDHSELTNLDFASAGHTGFASEAELLTVSGNLQTQIDTKGTLSNVVEDATPQLGGSLDAQSNDISAVNEFTAVTGTFTSGLTVGEGSTNIFNESITTGSGIFTTELTVSGIPVDTEGTADPLAIGTINVSTSLTVSGIPVDTTGGGGGSGGTAASGTVYMVDAPGSGSQHDDEFDDGVLDAAWTEWDVGGNATVAENAGEGFVEFNISGSADEWSGIFRAAPSPDQGWTIYTKAGLTMRNSIASDEAWLGLVVFQDPDVNPSTSDLAGIFLRGQDLTATNIIELRHSSYTAYNSAATGSVVLGIPDWVVSDVYLRCRYESNNNKIVVEYSSDGLGWMDGQDVNLSYDPGFIGLVAKKIGGSTTQARFQFFRLQTSSGRADHLRGANVGIWHPDQLIAAGGGGGGGVEALTVSGGSDITGTVDFVGANGVNVSDSGNTITIDGQGIVAGGGAGTLTDINTTATGPSVTITGVGNIQTITEGNVVTITGAAPSEGFRGALVTTSSGITVPNATSFIVPWDTVKYDTDGFFNASVDPAIFTIPAGINKVRVGGNLRWTAFTATTGNRIAAVVLDKATAPAGQAVIDRIDQGAAGTVRARTNLMSGVFEVTEGQTYSIFLQQNDSADRTLEASEENWFSLEVVDPVATTPNDISAISGSFTQSLTVSGIPVQLEGGGAGSLTDINTTATGPSVTITGVGGVDTITTGNTVLVSGTELIGKNPFRGALVTTTTGITVANTGFNLLPWDTVQYDTDDFFTINFPNRLTVPAGVNKVVVSHRGDWDVGTDGGYRFFQLLKNGINQFVPGHFQDRKQAISAAEATNNSAPIPVNQGDYFEIRVVQNSSASESLNTSNWFSIEVVEDNQSFQIDEITVVSGTFTESLTVSGIPVQLEAGGAGGLTDINAQTGPSITVTGVGNVTTVTDGNTVTISGALSVNTFGSSLSIGDGQTLALATAGGITLTLPNATQVSPGKRYVVKDRDGNAGSSDIVVTGTSSQTIDGSLGINLNTDFQSITLVSDGSNWSVI